MHIASPTAERGFVLQLPSCLLFDIPHHGTLCCRRHEAELRQSREECWGRQQELAAVREKLSNLKTTLEDRRKDIVSYKVNYLTRMHYLTMHYLR